MSEIQDQNTLKSKKYFVAVQQMQYFEIEVEEEDLKISNKAPVFIEEL